LALTNAETCDLFHWTEQDVFDRYYKKPSDVTITMPPALQTGSTATTGHG
jgi:hypothetical protein